jgi:excinuclease ABC subunit A
MHDVIKTADWVLDLGPGGGVNGGRIVVEGTPEQVAAEPKSFTGQYLKPLLDRSTPSPLEGEGRGEGPAPKKPRKRKAQPSEPDLPDLIPAK